MSQRFRRGDWLRGIRAEMHADEAEPLMTAPSKAATTAPTVSVTPLPLYVSEGLMPPVMLMSNRQELMSTMYAG